MASCLCSPFRPQSYEEYPAVVPPRAPAPPPYRAPEPSYSAPAAVPGYGQYNGYEQYRQPPPQYPPQYGSGYAQARCPGGGSAGVGA